MLKLKTVGTKDYIRKRKKEKRVKPHKCMFYILTKVIRRIYSGTRDMHFSEIYNQQLPHHVFTKGTKIRCIGLFSKV